MNELIFFFYVRKKFLRQQKWQFITHQNIHCNEINISIFQKLK